MPDVVDAQCPCGSRSTSRSQPLFTLEVVLHHYTLNPVPLHVGASSRLASCAPPPAPCESQPSAQLLGLIGQVPEYLKRQKEPDQLAALLQMLQCLLNNRHFAFLEIYVSGLVAMARRALNPNHEEESEYIYKPKPRRLHVWKWCERSVSVVCPGCL